MLPIDWLKRLFICPSRGRLLLWVKVFSWHLSVNTEISNIGNLWKWTIIWTVFVKWDPVFKLCLDFVALLPTPCHSWEFFLQFLTARPIQWWCSFKRLWCFTEFRYYNSNRSTQKFIIVNCLFIWSCSVSGLHNWTSRAGSCKNSSRVRHERVIQCLRYQATPDEKHT